MKSILAIAAIATVAGGAFGGTFYDQNVTNNAIFGTDNANGGFTVTRENGVEIGLRAKTRFNASNAPENTFNSNGDGSYTFQRGLPPTGFGWAPGSQSTASWNFEWSINSDFEETSGVKLSDLSYEMSIDFDPSVGTGSTYTFDPITGQPFFDHSIGTNATATGMGVEASDSTEYASLLASNNLVQNSWNMEFFDGPGVSGFSFDGDIAGVYTIMLSVFDEESNLLGSVSINVQVVPMPAASAMAGVGLLAIGTRRRRRA